MNFESSMFQYNYNWDSILFWTQYFFFITFQWLSCDCIYSDSRKIVSPLVSAVPSVSYLLIEQNLFWEQLEWYIRETLVWIPDLLFSDHLTLEELNSNLFKLWFPLVTWGWWLFQLLWISWDWLTTSVKYRAWSLAFTTSGIGSFTAFGQV